MSDTWITLRDGTEAHLGDELRITVQPGDEVFQGFLNEIGPNYIILANTGHVPVPGFGSAIGFPNASITDMEKVG